MKILNIGGSNSILKFSYINLLKDYFEITNKSIGATNSTYSLIQILRNNLLDDHGLLIFEYFVNDINHYILGLNNINRVEKTLIELIRLCIEKDIKLLFVLIYNKDFVLDGIFSSSLMYKKYLEIIQIYEIPYIDVLQDLKKNSNDWTRYYKDNTHLNNLGMTILFESILTKIQTIEKLKYNPELSYDGFAGLKLINMEDHLAACHNIKNSLINLNYIVIDKTIKFYFDRETQLLALEYICDSDSGYIELNNGIDRIQKNTLKNESFVLDQKKSMASIITFNRMQFNMSNIYTCKIIEKHDIIKINYDKERITYERESTNSNFKLVSILVTNNASLRDLNLS